MNVAAGRPLKVTLDVPVKPDPLITSIEPGQTPGTLPMPLGGVKLVIVTAKADVASSNESNVNAATPTATLDDASASDQICSTALKDI